MICKNIAVWACFALTSTGLGAQSLSIVPATPTPLDLVRLDYVHVGCTNPDSVKVAQSANRITVQADRILFPDCGTVMGYFEEFTLGRLPAGEYDADLVVNPPPPTLGPSLLAGSVHFTVAPLAPTGSLHPHEDYSDLWWNPSEPGWALVLRQSGDSLVGFWAVYDPLGHPTWYTVQSGHWARDTNNVLHYAAIVYRTSGPYWGGVYDPGAFIANAVGSADFVPQAMGHARFTYSVEGMTGDRAIERLRF